MTDAIDISGFLPEDTGELRIKTTDGRETGWVATMAGPSHPKTVSWNDVIARRNLDKAKRIEQAQANGRKYKADDKSPDEVRRDNVEDVVARIVDWTPVKIGSEIYDFSRAAELLIKPEMGWAFVQFLEYLGDERGFTKRSAKT